MDRTTIINKIQTKMNEITPYSGGDIINNGLVGEILNESTRTFLRSAPLHLLPTTDADDTEDGTEYTGESYDFTTGYVSVPSDYLRLASFKMEDWLTSVSIAISQESSLYQRQKLKHVRGGIEKPIVALVTGKNGRILEYYSVKGNHKIDHFYYVADTAPKDLRDDLIDGLTWQAAGDCFQILHEPELAKIAFQRVNEFYNQNL